MATAKDILALIKEKDVKFVDFRFTDPRGKWQHTARMASATDESSFVDGVMFDGSSIAGWKAINESDMMLVPDCSTAVLDPFAAQIRCRQILAEGSEKAFDIGFRHPNVGRIAAERRVGGGQQGVAAPG